MARTGAKTLCSLLALPQLPKKLEQAEFKHYDVICPSVKAIVCGSSIFYASLSAGNDCEQPYRLLWASPAERVMVLC